VIIPPGNTWANWNASPRSKVMSVLMPMTVLRGRSLADYSKKASRGWKRTSADLRANLLTVMRMRRER
jgi:hypothetical protein